jgi:hypothetical protein
MQLIPQSSYYDQNAFGNSHNFKNSKTNKSHISDPSPMNDNPFNNAPLEAPLFTVQQVQELQRQMTLQAQQLQGGGGGEGGQSQPQSQQQQFQLSQSLGNAPNTQVNSSNAPFMIMTQLPVHATPFATNLISNSESNMVKPNQNQNQQQAPQEQTQQQQNPFGMSNTSFANLMEPAQLNSNVLHSSSQANYQFPQQQQQSQSTDNTHFIQNATSTNSSNIKNSNNSNLNSSTSNTYLEQLMRNAYAAQQQGEQHTLQQKQLLQQHLLQQQQQHQQLQQQSNPNHFSSQAGQQQGLGHTMDISSGLGSANIGNVGMGMGMGITTQQQALYTLGSTVEPVSTKEPQESRHSLDLVGWKNFWDDDEDINDGDEDEKDMIMPPAPEVPPFKAKAKRKLQEQDQAQQLQQMQQLQQQQQQEQHVRSTDTDTDVCTTHAFCHFAPRK